MCHLLLLFSHFAYSWALKSEETCRISDSHSGGCAASYWLHAGFLLGLFFDPEDGGICSSGTSVDFHCTTRHYIPEDRTLRGDMFLQNVRLSPNYNPEDHVLHSHIHENLKCYCECFLIFPLLTVFHFYNQNRGARIVQSYSN
jgi:hypothetical protein